MDPTAPILLVWNNVLSIVVHAWCIIIAFYLGFRQNNHATYYYILDCAFDIIFVIDIYICFHTAYFDEPTLTFIFDTKKIRNKYLRSWFVLDLLSIIPYPLMLNLSFGFKDGTHVVAERCLMVLKVIRYRRVITTNYFFTKSKSFSSFDLLKNVFRIFFFISHFTACCWFFLGSGDKRYVRISEVNQTFLSTTTTTYADTWLDQDEFHLNHGSIFDQYVASLYWTLATTLTVGYGDIHAVNDSERLFSIYVQIQGVILFGLILTAVHRIIGDMDPNGRRKREKKQIFCSYLAEKPFSRALMERAKASSAVIIISHPLDYFLFSVCRISYLR